MNNNDDLEEIEILLAQLKYQEETSVEPPLNVFRCYFPSFMDGFSEPDIHFRDTADLLNSKRFKRTISITNFSHFTCTFNGYNNTRKQNEWIVSSNFNDGKYFVVGYSNCELPEVFGGKE